MSQFKPLKTKHWLALLTPLFVIVLITHLLAIDAARGRFSNTMPNNSTTFTTRIIELPATKPVTEKMPDAPSPPKPTKPKPKQPAPKQAPIIASPSDPAPTKLDAPTFDSTNTPTSPTAITNEPIIEPSPALPAQTIDVVQPTNATGDVGLPPPAFTAMNSGLLTYKVIFTKMGNANQGKAILKWQQDGEKYTLGMTASMLFVDVFTWGSTGAMSPSGLLPERFSDKRYRKSEVAAHFDRAQGKIIFSANKPEVDLQSGAQDRISVIWQIAGLLSADPTKYASGSTLSLQTVSAMDAEPWLFTVNVPETLDLPNGAQIALRITRNPRREFDQKVELWFAPDLNYLPVRFRFTETNGDYVDVIWQSIENLPNEFPR